jgi:hypothetical protein
VSALSDEESYIIKPSDPSAIFKLQDPTTIEQLLEQPFSVIAEVTAGLIASGKNFYAVAGCRLAQAALKGKVFERFAREFKELRDKGRIPDDFAEKRNGYNSWVELLTILDEETPDEERLEALKAMFFAMNKIGTLDAERILNYQLFQIAKQLSSGELLLLKAIVTSMQRGVFSLNDQRVTLRLWAMKVAGVMGHGLGFLVLRDSNALEQQGLINTKEIDQRVQPNTVSDGGNYLVDATRGRLTDLGQKFLDNIASYHIEMSR